MSQSNYRHSQNFPSVWPKNVRFLTSICCHVHSHESTLMPTMDPESAPISATDEVISISNQTCVLSAPKLFISTKRDLRLPASNQKIPFSAASPEFSVMPTYAFLVVSHVYEDAFWSVGLWPDQRDTFPFTPAVLNGHFWVLFWFLWREGLWTDVCMEFFLIFWTNFAK